MSPYEKADSILETVLCIADDSGVDLPEPRYAILGEPVISGPSVIVTLTAIGMPLEGDPNCNVIQTGTFSVVIARECANISAPDGQTIPKEAVKVAATQSCDGQILWDTAVSMSGNLLGFTPSTWNIGFVVTGGLAITSMMLTTAID